jgi:hypothetical protein
MSQPIPVQPQPRVSASAGYRVQDAPRLGSTAQPVAAAAEGRSRWTTLAFLAVLAGIAAVGLGGWVLFTERDGSDPVNTAGSVAMQRAASVLADPQAQRIPLAGSVGRIVLFVAKRGDAVLMLKGLGAAPAGRTYQAWVRIPGRGQILPAGTFDGAETFVPLTEWVTPGVRVSVTLEPEGGSAKPSRKARLAAVRPLSPA